MSKKQKRILIRIIAAAIMTAAFHFIPASKYVKLALYLVPYLTVGYDILKKAFLGILHRQLLDENFLMSVATVGAFAIALTRTGDYTEGVAVMLFYQIGELFQSYAVGKSRKSIASLMDIRPEIANVLRDGKLESVDPEEVKIGESVIVRVGERVPIDSTVILGESELDTSALTGESMPRHVSEGDSVVSGCINMTGELTLRTEKEFVDSTVSKILELTENASSRKSKPEKFISKFARFYTPSVCIAALLLAIVAPLYLLAFTDHAPQFSEWIYRALTFLVISCPCALVISIPLSFFAGIGGSSREGILVKGSNYLESLAKCECAVFDKTGTLTTGRFRVVEIIPSDNFTRDALLEYAAHAEVSSTHPMSNGIVRAYGKEVDRSRVSEVKEYSGKGVCATLDGHRVLVGNARFMSDNGIDIGSVNITSSSVYVALDSEYAGVIAFSDEVKDGVAEALAELSRLGVKKTVMLTGDSDASARRVASELGITEYKSGLLPQDKLCELEALIEKSRGNVMFTGDGINDSPVLSRADIGVSMGALGSDAAIEASDVVIMDDDIRKLPRAIKISRKCIRIVYQNIIFAIGIKLVCLVLGAVGLASMNAAIFADVGVMVLAVLNAMRALRTGK